MQHLGKNVVIALSLVAAGFFAAYLRFRPHLDRAGTFTDGVQEYGALSDTPVRYAIWEAPERLDEVVNTAARETRPAVSADGRWMVFSVGERGLNTELWIAELDNGTPRAARPLDELNTFDDELAPAFGDGALYFASNRDGGAGGLDIWRASFQGGELGHAEPLGPSVNTRVDETDPAPMPGSRALAFASNRDAPRGLGYDLFSARPNELGVFEVRPLAALNSRFDEREPAFTADGRTLLFASDRGDDARASFDLYRTLLDRGTWLPPEPLEGLNGPGHERAPWPSLDGFTLWFQHEDEATGVAADLYHARSLELFRQPSRPVGWLDLAILIALLLLALLALLAKRWDSLEVLYKCFLVSVVVHLLLLWWFRHIHPENEPVPLGPGEQTFQVRLASSNGPPAHARERNGALELERSSESEAEAAQPAREALAAAQDAPAETVARELSRAPAPATAAPSASASEASEPSAAEAARVALNDAQPAPARYDAPAAVLTVSARAVEVSGGAPTSEAAPARTRSAPAAMAAPAPTRSTAMAREASAPGAALPSRQAEDAQPLRADAARESAATVALPEERFERSAGEAVAMAALEARALDAARSDAPSSAPARAETGQAQPALESSTAAPSANSSALPLARATTEAPAPRRFDAPLAPSPTAAPARELALAQPTEPATPERSNANAPGLPAPAATAASLALPAPRASTAPSRADAPASPSRFSPTDAAPAPQRATPAFRPLVADTRVDDDPGPAAPDPFEHTPYRTRFGVAKELAIEEHGGSAETEAAVAGGLAYLASIQAGEGYWGDVDERDAKYHFVLVGKTGLALLAFLGAGHTQESDTEHSRVVRRAIDFLLAIQDEDSGHFGYTSSYGHAIATYALAECHALTGDPRLEPPLERAARHIRSQQKRSRRDPSVHGGWGYYYPDRSKYEDDDWPRVSVTAWQVMALESVRLGGIEVPDRVFEDAKSFIAHAWDGPRGAFRYSHQPQRLNSDYPILPGSTPAALFALSLMGEDLEAPAYRPALRFVEERAPRGYRSRGERNFVQRADANLYFWYYGTLAMFRRGGNDWRRWNESLKETLLPSQQDDGSWEPISIYATQYARDDDRDRSYTTAMCVLTLEVYYRYFTPLLAVDAPRDASGASPSSEPR